MLDNGIWILENDLLDDNDINFNMIVSHNFKLSNALH